MREPRKLPVSVVSIFYNRSAYVRDSVQSILPDICGVDEVILIDDGSGDDTLAELRKFEGVSGVSVYTHINQGFVKTLNRAIHLARNELIAVHGSGDYSYQDRFKHQAQFLNENPDFALVACNYESVNPDGRTVLYVSGRSGDVSVEAMLRQPQFTHGSVMYRKSIVVGLGGYEPLIKWSSDRDLFFRMIQKGKMHVLSEVLYRKYMREDGVSYNVSASLMQSQYGLLTAWMFKEGQSARERLLKKLKEDGLESLCPLSHPAMQKQICRLRLKTMILGHLEEAAGMQRYRSRIASRRYLLLFDILGHTQTLMRRFPWVGECIRDAARCYLRERFNG